MASRTIPILTYHSIDDSGSVISTSPSIFKKQIEFLWQNGYETLSLSEVISSLLKNKPFPEKKFVITFDDGYKNNYFEAFPILQEFGFKGTIFLIVDSIVKSTNGSRLLSTFENRPLLSWSEIDEMHKYGFEFGAHTLSHPDLTQVSLQQAEREIIQSKEEIQNHLGVGIKTFAYPYGKVNAKIKEIVKNNYVGACSTILGKVNLNCNPFLLKRVEMSYLLNFKLFSFFSSNTINFYLHLRKFLRELRQKFN